MPIQVQGNGGTVQEVDSTFRAARVVQRPQDVGALGAFGWSGITGILPAALGANSEVFQMRWTDSTNLCVVRSIIVSAAVSTTFFAAGVPVQIEGRIARSWSADGTGGTAQVFSTANTNKKRTSHALSKFSDTGVRIATTAALGAGTKTLDTNPFANIVAAGPITASLNGTIIAPGTYLWQRNTGDEWPIVLAQNEGIVIRSVAVPATGTWTLGVAVEWAEILSTSF